MGIIIDKSELVKHFHRKICPFYRTASMPIPNPTRQRKAKPAINGWINPIAIIKVKPATANSHNKSNNIIKRMGNPL